MSHFVTIRTQIKDIPALMLACMELGLLLIQNNEARGYGKRWTPGDYVIKLKGPYDIALNKQPDGTYGMTTDWWDGHVEKEVGKDFGRLLQLYGAYKAAAEAKRKGYLVQRHAMKDGSIKLVIQGV